jgi:hypothetical protein
MSERVSGNNLGASACGLIWSIAWNPPRSIEEVYDNFNPNSRSLGRKLNPQPPEYETDMLHIFWATFSFTTCVTSQWSVVPGVDSHKQSRRNSSCCLVWNKYQLNVFSDSIYCVSFEFTALNGVRNQSRFHLYNEWRQKYRKKCTPLYCIRSQELSTHSEWCATINSCTWLCFLFAAIHSEFPLLGTCLKDSVCVDENIIWCGLWFEVHTEVVMKSYSFWDATPCSPFKVNRRFGGTYCLHYHDRWIGRTRNQREAGCKD